MEGSQCDICERPSTSNVDAVVRHLHACACAVEARTTTCLNEEVASDLEQKCVLSFDCESKSC